VNVKGKTTDTHTRCVHYHSQLDIIAIKFKCCSNYYPCYECHAEEAGHTAQIWSKDERTTKAILCGMCNYELTIEEYFTSGNQCTKCHSPFNPKCSGHYHLYFEM
jgi:uncharacterized CHY-type Zn-finger protein